MPLFKEKWHVDDDLLEEVRRRFLEEVDSGPEVAALYHEDDIQRVRTNDWYIGRYILHQEQDIEKSLRMLKESLKFRKKMEVNTLKKSDLPADYFASRAVIIYNKDHRDHPVVVIRGKTHFKREEMVPIMQRYFLYHVEKGIRAADWGVVSILFDCTDGGIANMDLEMLRFIMNVFKRYCPWGLGYFLVYNMPWYLSAFWRMMRQWVPEKYVDKICFVDSNSIQEYIEKDQLPLCMGGTCTKMYEPKEGVELESDDEEDIPKLVTVR